MATSGHLLTTSWIGPSHLTFRLLTLEFRFLILGMVSALFGTSAVLSISTRLLQALKKYWQFTVPAVTQNLFARLSTLINKYIINPHMAIIILLFT
jgi:hypothetical protein